MMKRNLLIIIMLFFGQVFYAQLVVPQVYSDIQTDKDGNLYYTLLGKKFYADEKEGFYTLNQMKGNPQAYADGISFDFGIKDLSGKLIYGLINYEDAKNPLPVWFKKTSEIKNGKAAINIKKNLSGRYDMSNWEKSGKGTLSYRVTDNKGNILYDGIVSFYFENKIFKIAETITEGPFVNLLAPKSVVISFDLNKKAGANIFVNGKKYTDNSAAFHHEIKIDGLKSDTKYSYEVKYGKLSQKYSFKTAHKKGERKPFVFAYASDSRQGQGGGEHNVYGVNFYEMRKIAAAASCKDVAFVQFTGDLVNGYVSNKEKINLQYANWKRSAEPFTHYFPFVAAQGNHEFVGFQFVNKKGKRRGSVVRFPFKTESSSAVFASNFVNPHSSLKSEDGSKYDPNPDKTDFPPYDETVFYYTYDNVAVIVLNSDYWYCPSLKYNTGTSGNLHGYIMDNQLKWLDKTIEKLEKDKDIDHIFVTQHTPAFPDGGHTGDDMWYKGKNKYRPYIAGKAVDKGIIERRDEYLNILINKSTKVISLLTGDEHNYNKLKLSPDVNIYPDAWKLEKLKRKRTIWQINNGAAGAPYYAQDKSVPWTDAVSGFTTQNALVLIYVNGKKVSVKVLNPETLDIFDEYDLR
ncbi:MAG: metallophosphoesterase family protein [Chlorobi bacterium]|nr:metallophosphoesterase family protein [Chlorobiota bacterium]